MSKPSDHKLFRDLLPHVKRWQEGEAALRKIRELLQQDRRNALMAIFEMAEDHKLGWQMYLLGRFGVDAETMTILKGFRPPRTLEAAKALIIAGSLHTFWGRVLGAKKETAAALVSWGDPYAVRRDPYTAMESAVLEAFEELPMIFGVIARTAQNDEIKEWATARLATWTDTQIKLGEKRERLNAALAEVGAETGLSREQAKLLGLLPASLVAFAEWQQDEPFRPGSGGKNYVSRAADVLEKSGSEKEGKLPRLQYLDAEREGDDDLHCDDNLDWLITDLEQQTRFTKRQRQVYELDKAGYEEAKIAAQLGIDGGTVRVHRKGALDAMRRAARELGLLDTE